MGYGEYSHAAHLAITAARALPQAPPALPPAAALLRPFGVVRSCRDSEDHPQTLAIVFAFDVTGSMGEIPRQLATRTLPQFMRVLLDLGVPDPQLCFMAVGHARQDRAPLQVGQFESTAPLIDAWLSALWLEGGGAGQHEAYELALYFAATHMALDCVEQRGQRGLFFLTGDTGPNPAAARAQVEALIGDRLADDLPIRALIDQLQQRFEPFFLLAPSAPLAVERAWRELLGDRVVRLGGAEDAALVAAGLAALLLGDRPLPAVIDRLRAAGLGRREGARVAQALVAFAAGLGRDGAPAPWSRHTDLPRGAPPSGHQR